MNLILEEIEKLTSLRDTLVNFRYDLQIRMDDMSQQIKWLDMFSEIIEPYKMNYYTPLEDEVRHTIEDLNYLKYIDRLINFCKS